jgi:hypothetical protein
VLWPRITPGLTKVQIRILAPRVSGLLLATVYSQHTATRHPQANVSQCSCVSRINGINLLVQMALFLVYLYAVVPRYADSLHIVKTCR